jgi:hypothetical protein
MDEELPFPEGHFDIVPDIIQPVLDVPDEPEPELTEEQKEIVYKKQKAQRCKVIVLASMGLDPIDTNVSCLSHITKVKILNKVKELFETDDEEILKKFNEIVCEEILSETKDFTHYPIYRTNIV